jgi:hypothetical protein
MVPNPPVSCAAITSNSSLANTHFSCGDDAIRASTFSVGSVTECAWSAPSVLAVQQNGHGLHLQCWQCTERAWSATGWWMVLCGCSVVGHMYNPSHCTSISNPTQTHTTKKDTVQPTTHTTPYIIIVPIRVCDRCDSCLRVQRGHCSRQFGSVIIVRRPIKDHHHNPVRVHSGGSVHHFLCFNQPPSRVCSPSRSGAVNCFVDRIDIRGKV